MNKRSVDHERHLIDAASFTEPLQDRPAVEQIAPQPGLQLNGPGIAPKPVASTEPDAAAASGETGSLLNQALSSRLAILTTLFCVTGALGLPLLWLSPVFSRLQKLFWSIVVLVYTSALLGATWAIVVWAYHQLR